MRSMTAFGYLRLLSSLSEDQFFTQGPSSAHISLQSSERRTQPPDIQNSSRFPGFAGMSRLKSQPLFPNTYFRPRILTVSSPRQRFGYAPV